MGGALHLVQVFGSGSFLINRLTLNFMKMKKARIAFIALSLGMMGFLYAPAPAQTTNPPEEEENCDPDVVGGQNECGPGSSANAFCPIWNVKYEIVRPVWKWWESTVTISCETGGIYKCEKEKK
jgi:hypothetical protein